MSDEFYVVIEKKDAENEVFMILYLYSSASSTKREPEHSMEIAGKKDLVKEFVRWFESEQKQQMQIHQFFQGKKLEIIKSDQETISDILEDMPAAWIHYIIKKR